MTVSAGDPCCCCRDAAASAAAACGRPQPACSGRRSLRLLDDVALHGRKGAEKLILLVLRHVELVERTDEVLDERVEIAAADAHAILLDGDTLIYACPPARQI